VIGKRDAKSRAASLSASVASIDFVPIVMRTRIAEGACLLMGGLRLSHLLRRLFMAVPFFFFVRAGLDQRGRFSNTSFATGIAENTLGQPT